MHSASAVIPFAIKPQVHYWSWKACTTAHFWTDDLHLAREFILAGGGTQLKKNTIGVGIYNIYLHEELVGDLFSTIALM